MGDARRHLLQWASDMKIFLLVSVVLYLALTLGGGTAALVATIQIYTLWHREPPEILSASIVNTAAVFAASTFVGVLDMFMTLWTLLKSKEWEEDARKEREADRQAAAADRQERAAERELREAEHEAARQAAAAEREAAREAAEAERELRARELRLREAEYQLNLQTLRAERDAQSQTLQAVIQQLDAERAQREQMTARVLDLLEQISHRSNGNGSRPADSDPNPATPTNPDHPAE